MQTISRSRPKLELLRVYCFEMDHNRKLVVDMERRRWFSACTLLDVTRAYRESLEYADRDVSFDAKALAILLVGRPCCLLPGFGVRDIIRHDVDIKSETVFDISNRKFCTLPRDFCIESFVQHTLLRAVRHK